LVPAGKELDRVRGVRPRIPSSVARSYADAPKQQRWAGSDGIIPPMGVVTADELLRLGREALAAAD
jgi:hypothetical protein